MRYFSRILEFVYIRLLADCANSGPGCATPRNIFYLKYQPLFPDALIPKNKESLILMFFVDPRHALRDGTGLRYTPKIFYLKYQPFFPAALIPKNTKPLVAIFFEDPRICIHPPAGGLCKFGTGLRYTPKYILSKISTPFSSCANPEKYETSGCDIFRGSSNLYTSACWRIVQIRDRAALHPEKDKRAECAIAGSPACYVAV